MESKEEYCKCCKQVWYKKMLKCGLCPNCYDYMKTIKQEENEQLKKELADWKDGTMIVKYEKQLAEKDKEIADLEARVKTFMAENKGQIELIINLRHEICEEIREKLEASTFEMLYNGSDYGRFMAIIDQIEGEK